MFYYARQLDNEDMFFVTFFFLFLSIYIYTLVHIDSICVLQYFILEVIPYLRLILQ